MPIRGRLVDDADSAAAYEFFDAVDEEAVGGDEHVVRLQHGAELAGLFEVEQQLALAGCAEEDGVEFFEQRGVGIVQRDLDAQGIGQLDLDVFEGLNAGDGELRR